MSKEVDYRLLNTQLDAVLTGETNRIANLSNATALLYDSMPNINWAGFYFYDKLADNLVLGPFQGKIACVRIPVGEGVCGTSYKSGESLVVEDVTAFSGHIACDAASRSEIVLPISLNNELIGVLDIDAPITGRFDETDRIGLEQFVKTLITHL